MGAAEQWAQFGLAGLVIFALFLCLAGAFKHYNRLIGSIITDHKDAVSTMSSVHKSERTEWREANERSESERTRTIVAALDKIERKVD